MYQVSGIKNVRGFTLIEALTLLFIFAVISMTFLEMYSTGVRLIIESKNRLGATALANQKMEVIRSIDYDAIGTTTGVPTGSLLENETISVNTTRYRVHTFVQYVDDAFDGKQGQNPNDTVPNDYKRVRLTVSWGTGGSDQSVVLFGNFSPNGVETSSGGGTLAINVLDSSGSGVTGASVHIVNSSAGVNTTGTTDSTGNLTLPGAPAGTQNYTITVSKTGYYGVQTYPPYPTSAYNPVDVHASVTANTLNQKTIVMDRYVDITVRSKDPFGAGIPSIDFNMTGGKVLGTDPVTSTFVYGYNQNLSTDTSGAKGIVDQSYGQYTLSVSSTRYELYKLSTASTAYNIFDVPAGQTITADMILLDTQIGSVKVIVTNKNDGSLIAGASVRLANIALGYDVTQTTDQYGAAYFPKVLPALTAGTYDVSISATGFENKSTTVTVNGALITKTVQLE